MQTERAFFLDNLRSGLVMLVLFHHTAITYGGEGGWYWHEITYSHGASGISGLVLTFFCAVNQAFFMGFLFLLAGYFTPPSLERKGLRRFIIDRALRLAAPLLIFGFVLGPITVALAQTVNGRPFIDTLMFLWSRGTFSIGPLWFVDALLIFTAGYLILRFLIHRSSFLPQDLPGHPVILASALAVGVIAFALRLIVPAGNAGFAGLQIGYLASYTILFAIGCFAWKGRWLERFEFDKVKPWLVVTIITLPTLPAALMLSNRLDGFAGGWNTLAVLYAFWEPFVAWGIILYLLLKFRKSFNCGSWLSRWVAERSYTVFIIHPPILVGTSLALHSWTAPPLLKFIIVGGLTCIFCLVVASLLLRLPYSRRIL